MHQKALLVRVSDLISTLNRAAPDNLICPARAIFDPETVVHDITAALQGGGDNLAQRSKVVAVLLQARKNGLQAIERAFALSPHQARATTQAYSYLTDCIVQTAFDVTVNHFFPAPNPTSGERVCVIAVGGYGRGEMALYSDVDLLFLTPFKVTPWVETVVENLLYILWDMRIKVGHATRTIKDCIRLAKEDYTIRTSLVEQRFIAGDLEMAFDLQERIQADLFRGTAREFIEAKLDERETRHKKQGGQRYVVEPNVKEAKGGLRDLQSLFWIGKYVHGVQDSADLVTIKLFSQDEYDRFVRAEDFLWGVRCHLHIVAGRAMDQLTFDLQVEVANRMGYQSSKGRRGVEYFMQDYFRHATSVGELTRIFLTALEADHVKKEPLLLKVLRRKPKVRNGFAVEQNRLSIADEDTFLQDPLNLLRVFDEALRTGLLMHPSIMRLVSSNLHLVNDEMRKSPKAVQIFCDLLIKRGNPDRALRRMNELGLLAAFIPEFEPIVAMMQFNMYHSYTVDEHTIQTISHLARIERGELIEELPVASGILKGGVNRKVLYIALLLHDIGKGRPEDHSILGAKIARKVAPRLGLNKAEVDTVEWLVRNHLFMSDMAQKRDIADPRTVRDFAKAVKSVSRLDLLTVLTVCDISGVGPGVWNNWKAVLIRSLHSQTKNALENGLEDLNRENRGAVARKKLRAALSDWSPKDLRAETNRHYPPYWQGLHVSAQKVFAHLLRDLPENEIRIDLQPDQDRDATRACFTMVDHPGIFSRLTGALALVGANIVDARTFTTKDGFATAAFWIQDADGHPYEAARLDRLSKTIRMTLAGEVVASDAMRSKDKLKKREKPFRVPTHITFDNDGSEIYTIIEIDTRDRPALLYDLTRTFAALNINIANALIATYGEQVVDTFYVKDMFGLKYHSKDKQKTLEAKLRAAIEQGSERAFS